MERAKSQHIVTMYALIILLALVLSYTVFRMASNDLEEQGTWQCARLECGTYVDPVAWVAQNCAPAADGVERTCNVNLDGVNTPVPLSLINLTFVAEQCEAVACVQEVLTRAVNYTMPANS